MILFKSKESLWAISILISSFSWIRNRKIIENQRVGMKNELKMRSQDKGVRAYLVYFLSRIEWNIMHDSCVHSFIPIRSGIFFFQLCVQSESRGQRVTRWITIGSRIPIQNWHHLVLPSLIGFLLVEKSCRPSSVGGDPILLEGRGISVYVEWPGS